MVAGRTGGLPWVMAAIAAILGLPLFLSHVNDAGFWLAMGYFGLTVGETMKSWSVMDTVISVLGFAVEMLVRVLVTWRHP